MEGIMLDENKARRVKFWVKFQDLETIPTSTSERSTGQSSLMSLQISPEGQTWPDFDCIRIQHIQSLGTIACGINCIQLPLKPWGVVFFFFATSNFRFLILGAARVGGEAGHSGSRNIQDAMRLVKSVLSPGLSALSPQVGWGQRAWKGLDPLPFEKRDVFMYWIERSWVEVRKKMQKL